MRGIARDRVSVRRYLSLREGACSFLCPVHLVSYLRKDLKKAKHGCKNTGLTMGSMIQALSGDQKKSAMFQEEMAETLQG